VDLGVKAQMAEAIKILLDPNANSASIEAIGRTSSDFLAKMRGQLPSIPQTDSFIQNFYDDSARKLFQPLKDLEGKESSKFRSLSFTTKANDL
jgi:protein phosphatase-4 regulatory subunit 3